VPQGVGGPVGCPRTGRVFFWGCKIARWIYRLCPFATTEDHFSTFEDNDGRRNLVIAWIKPSFLSLTLEH
jgi:hypothetical protein